MILANTAILRIDKLSLVIIKLEKIRNFQAKHNIITIKEIISEFNLQLYNLIIT